MFTQATRWSGPVGEAIADATWRKAQPLWMGAGAHSAQRFNIIEGANAGQQMTVVRFNTRDDWEKAREKISHERSNLLKELETAGFKNEETMLLDEVIDQQR